MILVNFKPYLALIEAKKQTKENVQIYKLSAQTTGLATLGLIGNQEKFINEMAMLFIFN